MTSRGCEHVWSEVKEAVSEYGELVHVQACLKCRVVWCERLGPDGELYWLELSILMVGG